MRTLRCYLRDAPSLEPKGIGKVFCCLGISAPISHPLEEIRELVRDVLVHHLDLPDPSVAFEENEPLGTNYMLYKYHVLASGKFLASCRVVVRKLTVEEIVCTFPKSFEVRPVKELPEDLGEPQLPAKPPGSGIPPGQFVIDDFVIYRILGAPRVDVGTWRLRIRGLVEKPLELSYDEVLGLPRVTMVRDFHCVTGWSVRSVKWEGVSLRMLVEMSKPLANARWVLISGLDGYSAIVPLEDLASEDSMLVLKVNDRPLTPEQGFPARVFVPHLYGWKSVKWVSDMVLTDKYVDGFWEALGYHERGYVYLEERFKRL